MIYDPQYIGYPFFQFIMSHSLRHLRQSALLCLAFALLLPSTLATLPTCSAVPPKRFQGFGNCRPENVADYNKLCNTNYSTESLSLSECRAVCGTGYASYTNLGVLD